MSYYCVISVDKRDILKKSMEYYNNLINEMNYHNHRETGQYIERCWPSIFNTNFTIITKK